MNGLKCTIVASMLLLASAGWPDDHTAAKDHEVDTYLSLFSSSMIRNLRFAATPEPRKTASEEILLDAEFAARAEAQGITTQPILRKELTLRQDQEVLNTWLRHQISEDRVTTSDIEAYYGSHKDEFKLPETTIFHHLFLMVPPGDKTAEHEKLKRAEQIVAETRQGAAFEDMIRKHSELPAAKTEAGKVGPVPITRLNPALQPTLHAIKPGSISDPVRTPYGWEVLRVDERTSTSTRSLNEVRATIRDILLQRAADEIRETASDRLAGKYRVEVNDDVVSGTDPLTSDSVVVRIQGHSWTVEDVLQDARALADCPNVPDARDCLQRILPRLILTEQIKLDARNSGLLNNAELQAKLDFIRNRYFAEEFFRTYRTTRQPTEAQLKASYEAEKEVFRGPPHAKGILYTWNLPAAAQTTTSPAQTAFQQSLLVQRVSRLLTDVRAGRIGRNALAQDADETTSLDWFREGPMGYHHDMAWFKTEPGNFTEPYVTRNTVAVGWVEQRRAPEQMSYELARDKVFSRLVGQWSREERKALVEEALSRIRK